MRVNYELRSLMMDFLEKNPSLITNKFEGPNGREKNKQLWQELSNLLNSQGFGIKSIEGWKNTFADWKSKTKQKARDLRLYQQGTGGGPGKAPLTDLEERLMQIIGWTSVCGDEAIEEYGVPINEFIISTCAASREDSGNEVPQTAIGVINTVEHNYSMSRENKRPLEITSTPKSSKRKYINKENPITEYHKETMDVLGKIEGHLSTIANAMEKIANNLSKK